MLSRPLSWWIDKLVGCQAVKACPPALRRLGCLADKRQAVTRPDPRSQQPTTITGHCQLLFSEINGQCQPPTQGSPDGLLYLINFLNSVFEQINQTFKFA